jgi:MFS family permease
MGVVQAGGLARTLPVDPLEWFSTKAHKLNHATYANWTFVNATPFPQRALQIADPGENMISRDSAERTEANRHDAAIPPETTALKLALTGLAGSSIEWYDFFLYATAAALVFPSVFFPSTLPPLVALIASFSTFAVGFLARPIGAVVFGHIGDRLGRKTALVSALIVMGTATSLIGLLPTYRAAGGFSPLVLVLLRLTQGLAVGGQWGGAMLLATENAPKARRGLYGSIAQAGVPVGVVLANLAFLAANTAMSPEAFMNYGWRIPFLLSIAFVGVGIIIQLRMEDTLPFRRLQQASRAPDDSLPILEAFRLHPKMMILAAGAYVSTNLSFYIQITYVVSYGTSVAGLHLPRSTMLAAVLVANVVVTPILFLAGSLSDRYGRRRLFMAGVALMGIWSFILFPLIETRSFVWITTAVLIGSCFNSLTYGPMAAMFAELFSTPVRCSAVSLAYQLGAIVGGGLAPVIATALYAKYHSNFWVSVYVSSACVLSLWCASLLKETRGTDLNERVASDTATALAGGS